MNTPIIYTIDGCPYCSELKELLTAKNIDFTEVNVSLPENSDEFEKLHKVTNSDEVPIVLVGKQILVPNVSFQSILEASELVQRFLEE